MGPREDNAFSNAPKEMSKKGKNIALLALSTVAVLFVIFFVFIPMIGHKNPAEKMNSAKHRLDSLQVVQRKAQDEKIKQNSDIYQATMQNNRNVISKPQIDSQQNPATAVQNEMSIKPLMERNKNAQPDAEDPAASAHNMNYNPSVGRPAFMHTAVVRNDEPYRYIEPNEFKRRLDPQYQAIVNHLRGSTQDVWQVAQAELVEEKKTTNVSVQVDKSLQNLYEGATQAGQYNNMIVSAGSRIIAVTEQEVNSDHPGLFTSRIVRPYELNGMEMICQSSGNQKDRIPVNIVKIVNPKTGSEYQAQGQVEMEYAGLSGAVRNNWLMRVGPQLINTVIGAGAIAATYATTGGTGQRIDTRDVIAGDIAQQSVTSLQNEVSRMGGDYPNTVIIPQGTQFDVLLQNQLTLK